MKRQSRQPMRFSTFPDSTITAELVIHHTPQSIIIQHVDVFLSPSLSLPDSKRQMIMVSFSDHVHIAISQTPPCNAITHFPWEGFDNVTH